MRAVAKVLGLLGLSTVGVVVVAALAAVIRGHWKYRDQITVSADAVVDSCEEGCDWFRITNVDDPKYEFARGWLIDGTEGRSFAGSTPSYKYIDSAMAWGSRTATSRTV